MNTNEEVSNATPIVVVKNNEQRIPETAHVISMPLPYNDELTDEMFRIYNLSKTTRFLAVIDLFFALIYSFYNVYFFMAFLTAFSGYYGAKYYNSCSLLVYASYLFLNNVIRIITVIYMVQYYHDNMDEDNNNIFVNIVFATIICILNAWIARFVCVFWNLVKDITPEDKMNLILMEKQRKIAPNYIWRV